MKNNKFKLLTVLNNLIENAMLEMSFATPDMIMLAKQRLTFVKWLNFKYRDNTVMVNDQEEYDMFLKEGPKLGFGAPSKQIITRDVDSMSVKLSREDAIMALKASGCPLEGINEILKEEGFEPLG